MHRGRIKILRQTLIFLIFGLICGYSIAQEELAKKEKQLKDPNPKTNIADPRIEDDHWVEMFHRSVSNSVFQSAAWFDNFFNDKGETETLPKVVARIRLGWKPKSRDWGEFESRFRIKLRLPHLKNKVDLILSDESDIEQSQLPLEKLSVDPDANDESFSAALRYTFKKKSDRSTETRVGISGGDIFVRAKHKRYFKSESHHGFKIEPSTYYFLDDGLGARLLLEYDYQLSNTEQFRVNYSIRGSESFSGIRWKHGFYKLNQLNETTASIWTLQVQGERNGDDGFLIDKYSVGYRYRFNALRKWLYFEIEPFLEWPEEENYTTTPGIALRVEGFFYKK